MTDDGCQTIAIQIVNTTNEPLAQMSFNPTINGNNTEPDKFS